MLFHKHKIDSSAWSHVERVHEKAVPTPYQAKKNNVN